MLGLKVSYGHQSWTTATHLVPALRPLTTVQVVGRGQRRLSSPPGDHLLWIESGRRSLPTPVDLLHLPSSAWMIDTHRGMEWRIPFGASFDHVFVAQRAAIPAFESLGVPVEWLPLAVPACECATTTDHPRRSHDIAFIGNADPAGTRGRILRALREELSVTTSDDHVEPDEMMAIYRRSRIVLNPPLAGDLNMRVFEAAGAGAMLLTSAMDSVEHVLPPGSYELVEGTDPAAWVAAAKRLLAEPEETERRAEAARQAVTSMHTYDHRAATVVSRLADLPRRQVPPSVRLDGLVAAAAHYRSTGVLFAPGLSRRQRTELVRHITNSLRAGVFRRVAALRR